MLIACLIVLTILFWTGIVCAYFRREITEWLDNRYGPDHKDKKMEDGRKPFWRFYG